MTKYKIKIIVIALLALPFIVYGIDTIKDERKRQFEIAAYAPLIELIGIEDGDNLNVISDKVRLFVNKNSIHNIDEEFRSHWGEHDVVGEKLYNYATQKSNKPVHLECSSRRAAMERIMQGLGYRTRSVDLYSHTPEYAAHSLLEVLDPKTNQWIAQDPGFNIFWTMKDTGKRISMVDAVKYGPDNIIPCHTDSLCGWDLTGYGGQSIPSVLKKYLGMAVTIDRIAKIRNMYYHPDIFPIEQTQPIKGKGQMTYCAYRKKNCRGEIIDMGLDKNSI